MVSQELQLKTGEHGAPNEKLLSEADVRAIERETIAVARIDTGVINNAMRNFTEDKDSRDVIKLKPGFNGPMSDEEYNKLIRRFETNEVQATNPGEETPISEVCEKIRATKENLVRLIQQTHEMSLHLWGFSCDYDPENPERTYKREVLRVLTGGLQVPIDLADSVEIREVGGAFLVLGEREHLSRQLDELKHLTPRDISLNDGYNFRSRAYIKGEPFDTNIIVIGGEVHNSDTPDQPNPVYTFDYTKVLHELRHALNSADGLPLSNSTVRPVSDVLDQPEQNLVFEEIASYLLHQKMAPWDVITLNPEYNKNSNWLRVLRNSRVVKPPKISEQDIRGNASYHREPEEVQNVGTQNAVGTIHNWWAYSTDIRVRHVEEEVTGRYYEEIQDMCRAFACIQMTYRLKGLDVVAANSLATATLKHVKREEWGPFAISFLNHAEISTYNYKNTCAEYLNASEAIAALPRFERTIKDRDELETFLNLYKSYEQAGIRSFEPKATRYEKITDGLQTLVERGPIQIQEMDTVVLYDSLPVVFQDFEPDDRQKSLFAFVENVGIEKALRNLPPMILKKTVDEFGKDIYKIVDGRRRAELIQLFGIENIKTFRAIVIE